MKMCSSLRSNIRSSLESRDSHNSGDECITLHIFIKTSQNITINFLKCYINRLIPFVIKDLIFIHKITDVSPSVVELLHNDNLTMLPYNLFSPFIKFHIIFITTLLKSNINWQTKVDQKQ